MFYYKNGKTIIATMKRIWSRDEYWDSMEDMANNAIRAGVSSVTGGERIKETGSAHFENEFYKHHTHVYLTVEMSEHKHVRDFGVGVAQCHPQDVYDEEYGKMLARQRMIGKFESMQDKIIKKTCSGIAKTKKIILDDIQVAIKKAEKRM